MPARQHKYRLLDSLLAGFCCGAVSAVTADVPLNVILLMTDDQGYPDLACHGNPVVQTPNMDQLAKQGVQFSDFHVNPFCSPTRAALMTGRMSDRTGVTSTNTRLNYMFRREVLMPEFFKASGYRTGLFGKWHIGANYPFRPMDRGFDEWFGLGNNGLAAAADLWDNDRMNDTYWHNGKVVKRDGFDTDVYFDAAMNFMKESRGDGKPFFTYLVVNAPHFNWNVPEEWLAPYLDSGSRERAGFYASIARVDWNLGRLMAFLEAEGLTENTILVFLTDNGSDIPDKQSAFNAGMKGFKLSVYEGGHRVPCFFLAPESVMGLPRVIDELTAHVDLLPTFIDYCGLKKPDRELPPLDGRSLRPLLNGSGEWADRMLVLHSQNSIPLTKNLKAAVLTSEWRMIQNKPDQKPELYRIRADRGQERNLADQYPDVVKNLQEKYNLHWSSLPLRKPSARPVLARGETIRLSCDLAVDANRVSQHVVRIAAPIKPVWELEAPETATYRFEVRRWPREVKEAMTAGIPPTTNPDISYIGHPNWHIDVPGKALDIKKVELILPGQTLIKDLPPGAEGVVFDVEMQAGEFDVEAWFIDSEGNRAGAYFVYAEQIFSDVPCHAEETSRLIDNLESGKPQTVVAYGTSLTAAGAWVGQLQEILNSRYPGQARVINSGKGSMWSGWGVENLDARVIAKKPDTVFIEFAVNDAYLPYKASVEQAQDNLENMIDRILESNPECEIILMVMNPPIGIRLSRRPRVNDYYQMYRDVAEERKFLLIDHYPAWEKILNEDPELFNKYIPDGIHPAANGCRTVIVPNITKALGIDG